jgi:hypothetical protein
MFRVETKYEQSMKDMKNLIAYSEGFLEGAKRNKTVFLDGLGLQLKETLGQYIDSMARVDPQSLHHVYEWYKTGSSDARLFDIDYTVSGVGLSIYGTLTQSKTVAEGSKEPFYNKARVMESGSSVTIKPKTASKLKFNIDGRDIYSSGPITVTNPGGNQVRGSFHNTFKQFMESYLSQSLLDISGFSRNLANPIDFKENILSGIRGGRSVGIRVGMNWIAKGVA